jgi:ABC-type lipoprotein export system ATPase subunit
MIEAKNLGKFYQDTILFDASSFILPDQGFYLLTGDNRSGKTTLLCLLAQLDFSYRGELWIAGKKMSLLKPKERRRFAKENISLTFSKNNLFDDLSPEANATLGTVRQDLSLIPTLLGRSDSCGLSGGEELLVSIQHVINADHPIRLFDEVTSGLDEANFSLVLQLLKQMSQTSLVILAHHDDRLSGQGKEIAIANQRIVIRP